MLCSAQVENTFLKYQPKNLLLFFHLPTGLLFGGLAITSWEPGVTPKIKKIAMSSGSVRFPSVQPLHTNHHFFGPHCHHIRSAIG